MGMQMEIGMETEEVAPSTYPTDDTPRSDQAEQESEHAAVAAVQRVRAQELEDCGWEREGQCRRQPGTWIRNTAMRIERRPHELIWGTHDRR